MGFGAIKYHCLNTYLSALAWTPSNSEMCQLYGTWFANVQQVVVGLAEPWGPLEHIMKHSVRLPLVMFSPDGCWVVSGSRNLAQIWNVNMREIVYGLQEHLDLVTSVRFSPDGCMWYLA